MRRGRWAHVGSGTALTGALALLVTGGAISPAAAQSRSSALPEIVVEGSNQSTPVPGAGIPGAGESGNGPVTGYLATRSVTATKTDTPVLVTPQSISIITRDQIQQQGSQTVVEALRYTPGVSIDGFGTGVFFDSVKIRGFNAPTYLDGLRVPNDSAAFAVPRFETYGLERIEVLKGPSSGLYGQSEPGGLLNLVSKRPLPVPRYEVVGTVGSYDRFQGAFDIGGPIDQQGQFLYRLVGLGRSSDTQTDFMEDNRLFIAPSFTWRPTVDTSLTILSHYQKIDNAGYQQYVPGEATLLRNPFGRMPRSNYLGEPSNDRYALEQGAIGYAFEHRFDNTFQFRQNFRYMEVSNDMASMRGDFMVADRFFYRTPIYVDARARNIALDNQLQADFTTGPLTHKVLAGFDYQNTRSSNDSRLASPFTIPQNYFPIDVFNPVYGQFPLPSRDALFQFIKVDTRLQQAGIYLQDEIKLDRWRLFLTGRQDWADTENISRGFFPPAGNYNRSDSATTGRVGLSYLFDFGLAPYISYSTSFVPNTGVDRNGNSFKPTTGEGKEIGIKYMPAGMNLMLTAAAFEITQDNVLTTDPVNPLVSAQTDQARVRGFEVEARGNITRELEIIVGFSHLDPKVTKSIAGAAGNYLPNVTLNQGALWGKYTWFDGPLAGLGLGAGVRFIGGNYGDAANTIYIPSNTLFDAAVSYDFAYLRPDLKGWKAQVNLTNIGDTYYVSSCQGGLPYCGFGAGRTILGSLRYAWN